MMREKERDLLPSGSWIVLPAIILYKSKQQCDTSVTCDFAGSTASTALHSASSFGVSERPLPLELGILTTMDLE